MAENEESNGYEIDENQSIDDVLKEVSDMAARENAASGSTEQELNDKYMRLYADFENYRKRVNKDKEELARYGNESLIYELLPVIDSLELALKHSGDAPRTGLVEGVEITMKELLRTLEKFGLTRIPTAGKPFDPSLHHAMIQVERDDMEEKMVAEEMRAGYQYREKVLRPSLVAVSAKPKKTASEETDDRASEAGAAEVDGHEIKINRIIEEE